MVCSDPDMGQSKILIVDDDAGTRLVLSAILRANNYDAVMAVDSIQAISVARKESPHLVLLDIEMPGGDGFIVMQRLKAMAAFAGLPFVIMSSSVEQDKAESKSAEAGAEAYLTKPVNHDELLAVLTMILG
jgi:DNA-binding response OmpR family regulator